MSRRVELTMELAWLDLPVEGKKRILAMLEKKLKEMKKEEKRNARRK